MALLITSGYNPDLDGIASALGLAALKKLDNEEIIVAFEGSPQLDAQFYLNYYGIDLKQIPYEFDNAIVVDTSSAIYLPQTLQRNPSKVIEVIDHHLIHTIEEDFPNIINFTIKEIGACATIVAELLEKNNVTVSRMVAEMLYGAILSNTLNLHSSNTTNKDKDIANSLRTKYAISNFLAEQMFIYKSNLNADRLREAISNDLDISKYPRGKTIGIAQIELLDGLLAITQYIDTINICLNKAKITYKLDYIFITIPSINHGINYLYAPDTQSFKLLEKALKGIVITLEDKTLPNPIRLLQTKNLMMRKQLKPLLYRI